ncbi:F-box protein-like [Iris pallida]|uniref:F-box protein-like n=1 Tax=Iris pallida TaxID=29817 RepID=A0AAX6IM33_IRIPA|nr:F-box protein-like [Iris pallida]
MRFRCVSKAWNSLISELGRRHRDRLPPAMVGYIQQYNDTTKFTGNDRRSCYSSRRSRLSRTRLQLHATLLRTGEQKDCQRLQRTGAMSPQHPATRALRTLPLRTLPLRTLPHRLQPSHQEMEEAPRNE